MGNGCCIHLFTPPTPTASFPPNGPDGIPLLGAQGYMQPLPQTQLKPPVCGADIKKTLKIDPPFFRALIPSGPLFLRFVCCPSSALPPLELSLGYGSCEPHTTPTPEGIRTDQKKRRCVAPEGDRTFGQPFRAQNDEKSMVFASP